MKPLISTFPNEGLLDILAIPPLALRLEKFRVQLQI